MFQFATPEAFEIYGYDTHRPTIKALNNTLETAGFDADVKIANLEEAQVGQFDIGLINPPYSIHLEHPNLSSYPTNSYGRYGPSTSALSQNYALEQALEACQIVVAVIPKSMVSEIKSSRWQQRCCAIISLGKKAFAEENATVDTVIAVFDSVERDSPPIETTHEDYTNLGIFAPLTIGKERKAAYVRKSKVVDFAKSINTDVTNNPSVKVSHSGRNIILKFACGLTEAKVLNKLYKDHAARLAPEKHRLAKDIEFVGSSRLDIESYMVQEDPQQEFDEFIKDIQSWGGQTEICPTLQHFFKKRIREVEINTTPLRKWVYKAGQTQSMESTFSATAKNNYRIFPKQWGSPTIKAGERVEFEPCQNCSEPTFSGTYNGKEFIISKQSLADGFVVEDSKSDGDWVCIHQGLIEAFPKLAAAHRAKAKHLGIDQWLWDFQLNDVIEASMRSVGTLFGWHMGTGKTFGNIAMCLMGGKHNLLVLQPHLVEQAIEDIEQLPINRNEWQIISNPDDLNSLKRINFITYNKLRSALHDNTKKTFAHALRNRIHTLNLDEGHVLSNTESLQTKACWTVNAKKVNSFTGTPMPNYPRNIHPQAALVVGDGTAEQPYGLRRSYLSRSHLKTPYNSPRGLDQLANDFCTFEWVTHQFEDDHQSGGKREIPVIKKPQLFRDWVDTFLKRRIKDEPECSKYIQVKDPVIKDPAHVEWDDAHLAHYFKVADEFTTWFKNHVSKNNGKINNMMAVLARINAVEMACNAPGKSKSSNYGGQLTTKQIAVINRAEELYAKGHKVVVYATNPDALNLMSEELSCQNVNNVAFHGEISIKNRNKCLNAFRTSVEPMVLLASYGCTETGLNIWQADRILQYNRCWSSKIEEQSIYRLIRPKQTKQVITERFHLEGAIDDYQAQMCAFKKNCIDVGVDYGEPIGDDIDFLHMDKILHDFTETIAKARGFSSSQELKESLKLAA